MGRPSPKKTPWAEIQAAFESCQEMPEPQRARFLDELGKKNPELRSEVESLIQAANRKTNVIGKVLSPAFERFAKKSDSTFRPGWFGKFYLLRRIAVGGMAEVYLARVMGPAGFERLVALKKPLPHGDNRELRHLFEYEAQLAGILTHVNIVHVYDFCLVNDDYALTLEFVEGKNLSVAMERSRNESKPLPADCAIHLVTEVCKALEYAHTRTDKKTGEPMNIVHRDISPKNILVSYEGDVKLFDFGIAKGKGRHSLTMAGAVRGTIPYLSPEAVEGKPTDKRSDLFALSVVLFECLSGNGLFDHDELPTLFRMIKNCEGVDDKIAALDVSPRLKNALRKGLAKSPDDRYANARELETDLIECARELGESSTKERLARHMSELFFDDRATESEELAVALRDAGFDPPALPKQTPPVASAPGPRPSSRAGLKTLLALALSVIVAVGVALKEKASPPSPEPARTPTPTVANAPSRSPAPTEAMGSVEILLDRNARIYLDGRFIAEVIGGHRFEVSVVVKKTHQLRFVNEELGLDFSKEVSVEPGNPLKLNLTLEKE